jgi:hypothetical protein
MEADIKAFISSTFGSVWTLELLLQLKREPERAFSAGELVSLLRASELVVGKGAASLVAAGLVVEHGPASYSYAPASRDLAEMVSATEQLYRSRPDTVRRIIVAGAANELSAFSDAFRLRGDT